MRKCRCSQILTICIDFQSQKRQFFFLRHKTADRLISDKSVSKEIRKSKDSSYVSWLHDEIIGHCSLISWTDKNCQCCDLCQEECRGSFCTTIFFEHEPGSSVRPLSQQFVFEKTTRSCGVCKCFNLHDGRLFWMGCSREIYWSYTFPLLCCARASARGHPFHSVQSAVCFPPKCSDWPCSLFFWI